jgi:hypothetical protein
MGSVQTQPGGDMHCWLCGCVWSECMACLLLFPCSGRHCGLVAKRAATCTLIVTACANLACVLLATWFAEVGQSTLKQAPVCGAVAQSPGTASVGKPAMLHKREGYSAE